MDEPIDAKFDTRNDGDIRDPNAGVLKPRHAATLIVVRDDGDRPRLLMGRRNRGLAFMADKWVFPGGRVDRGDYTAPSASELSPDTTARLALEPRHPSPARLARALALAAVRETFEETGLILGKPLKGGAPRKDYGEHWKGFLDQGMAPALDSLDLIARAITPPGRPRRFNARFFMARAEDASGEIRHSSEMGDVRWVKLNEARELPLPTITGLILGEIGRLIKEPPDRKKQRKIPLFITVHRKHLMIEE